MKKYLFVLLLALGCGAEADGGQDLGQASEAVAAPTSLTHQLFGTDVSAGGTVNALFQCKDNGATNQDCRWMRPYKTGIPGGAPARYSVNAPGNRPDDTAIRADVSLVVNAINNQMALQNQANNAVIDQNADGRNCLVLSEGVNVHVPAFETHVAKYITANLSACQGTSETEVTPQPGAFRSCASSDCEIDTISLRANFPSSSFAGNLRQAVAACILVTLGEGLQSGTTAMNFNVLSPAAQALTFPLENSQAKQLRIAAISETNPGGNPVYNVPCTGALCFN